MRKFYLFLLLMIACVGSAWANTTLYPLSLSTIWTKGNGIEHTDGNMKFTGSSSTWSVYCASSTLSAPLSLEQLTDKLTLSYTFNVTGIDAVTTVALSGDNGTVFMGHSYNKSTTIKLASTDNNTARGYQFATTSGNNICQVTTGYQELATSVTASTDITLSLNIAYDAESSHFIGTLNCGSSDSKTVDLGETFNVKNLIITFDGNTTTNIKNMSLETTTSGYTVTYNYKYNGTAIGSKTFTGVLSGSAYPTTKPSISEISAIYVAPGLLDFATPTGTVTEDYEGDVNVSLISTFPFTPSTISSAFDKDTKWYTMKIKSSYYLAYDETNSYFTTTDETRAYADNYLFAFVGDPLNGYSIYNKAVGASNVLYTESGAEGSNVLTTTSGKWSIGANGTGYWMKEIGSTQANSYMDRTTGILGFWNADAAATGEGARLTIESVGSINDLQSTLSTTLGTVEDNTGSYVGQYATNSAYATAKALSTSNTASVADLVAENAKDASAYYTVNALAAGQYVRFISALPKYYAEQSKYKAMYSATNGLKWADLNESDLTQIYYIYSVDGNTFTMYNLSDGTYGKAVTSNSTQIGTSLVPNTMVMSSLTSNQYNFKSTGSSNWFHTEGHSEGKGTSGNIVIWGGTENSASAWYLQLVDATEAMTTQLAATEGSSKTSLQSAYDQYNSYEVSDELGKCSDPSALATPLANAKAVLDAETYSKYIDDTKYGVLVAAAAALTYNKPVIGKFYKIKNKETNTYLAVTSYWVTIESNAGIYYVEDAEDGLFYLLEYQSGLYRNDHSGDSDHMGVNLQKKFKWSFEVEDYGYFKCRYNSSGIGTGSYMGGNGSYVWPGIGNTNWTFQEVTTLPLTIGTTGYATFSAPVETTAPEGTTAYYVSAAGTTATLTPYTNNIIPANQGAILYHEGGANVSLTISNTSASVEGNKLVANVAASVLIGTDKYILANKNSQVGFYKFKETTTSDTNPSTSTNYTEAEAKAKNTLGGHKCYLTGVNAGGVKEFLGFIFGDETGINNANVNLIENRDGKYLENGKIRIIKNGKKYNVAGQMVK